MGIGKPLRFLFYVVLRWHEHTSPVRSPAILPTTVVTILLCLNILVVIQLVIFLCGLDTSGFKTYPDVLRLFGYLCFASIYGIIWMSMVRTGAYTKFGSEFPDPFPEAQPLRKLWVYSYVIVSALLPLIVKHVLRKLWAP
jgi:hypothetical protein